MPHTLNFRSFGSRVETVCKVRNATGRGFTLARPFRRKLDTPLQVISTADESFTFYRPDALASFWHHAPTGSLSNVEVQTRCSDGCERKSNRRRMFLKESPTARGGGNPPGESCRSVPNGTVYDKRITRDDKPVKRESPPDHRVVVMAIRSS